MTALDTIKQAVIGVPMDPQKQPSRVGVVQAFSEMQTQLEGAQSGALVFDTYDALAGVGAVPSANIMAWVMTGAQAGIYQNAGSAITPAWTRRGSIPQFLVTGINVGAGTANAIHVTTDIPFPTEDGRALLVVPVLAANSASPPTVSINGGTALPIVTNSGNNVVVGGITANMNIAGFVTDGKFQLLSDQASAAIVAAAEAWVNVAIAAVNGNLSFIDAATASAATIDIAINSIMLKGYENESDELGGQWTDDVLKGSNDSFVSSGATSRTWYRVKDISYNRISTSNRNRLLSSSPDINIVCDPYLLKERYNFLADRDIGNHNVLQKFVFDEINRHVYVSHITGSAPELTIINRYRMDGPVNQASIDFQNASSDLRHQALSIEYLTGGNIKLWSSSETDRTNLVRFDYTPNGAPASMQLFKVWEGSTAVVNPVITRDQRFIVVQSENEYRWFDFQAMLAGGPGDYSGQEFWKYTVGEANQGFDIHGNKLLTINGTGPMAEPRPWMKQYDISSGQVEIEINNVLTGNADALVTGAGVYNEPEGLVIYRENPRDNFTIALGMAQGDAGIYPGRVNRVYTVPKTPNLMLIPDEADAIIAALSSPSSKYKRLVGNAIRQFVETGLWNKFGALWILAATSSGNAKLDWKHVGSNPLIIPTIAAYTAADATFVSKTGLQGTTNSLLRSTLPISGMGPFANDDNHMSVFCVANESIAAAYTEMSIADDAGTDSNWLLRARSTGNKINARNGGAATVSPSGTLASALEDITLCRTSNSQLQTYFRGQTYFAGPVAQTRTTSAAALYAYLFGRTTSGAAETTPRTIAAASIGAALTRTQAADKRNILKELLIGIAEL